ncbi:uncharacterized protein AH6.3-like [Hyperolius riggenbachi]|uniref:uncharacterized protein AH6.3-like n=1 Tax=Hyperolius riggenbachi TaxID=752182 RepID=UPI0035A2B77A
MDASSRRSAGSSSATAADAGSVGENNRNAGGETAVQSADPPEIPKPAPSSALSQKKLKSLPVNLSPASSKSQKADTAVRRSQQGTASSPSKNNDSPVSKKGGKSASMSVMTSEEGRGVNANEEEEFEMDLTDPGKVEGEKEEEIEENDSDYLPPYQERKEAVTESESDDTRVTKMRIVSETSEGELKVDVTQPPVPTGWKNIRPAIRVNPEAPGLSTAGDSGPEDWNTAESKKQRKKRNRKTKQEPTTVGVRKSPRAPKR